MKIVLVMVKIVQEGIRSCADYRYSHNNQLFTDSIMNKELNSSLESCNIFGNWQRGIGNSTVIIDKVLHITPCLVLCVKSTPKDSMSQRLACSFMF